MAPAGQTAPVTAEMAAVAARMPAAARLMSPAAARLSALIAVSHRLAEPITPFQARLFCSRAALLESSAAITVPADPTNCPAAENADCAALSVDRLASMPPTTVPADWNRV